MKRREPRPGAPHDAHVHDAPPLFYIRRATVVRAGRVALDDVTLAIPAGASLAIVGPNGCGKSTLLAVLARELHPVPDARTSVRVLGRERWNAFELRRAFGIVSSDLAAALAGGADSVLDVACSGFFATHGLSGADAVTDAMRDAARAALSRVGLEALASRPIAQLSSGQARRALLARALVHAPRTLLLDEPSSALDVRARAELRASLRELAREGVALVLATHDFAEIVPEIERAVLMRAGRIVADGPRAAMLAPGRLAALFEVPIAACAACGALEGP